MKKLIILSLMALPMSMLAQESSITPEKQSYKVLTVDDMMKPLEPSYLQNYIHTGDFLRNWFFGLQGGLNVLNGNPLGCGDFFDRSHFGFNANLGKWITPNIGLRFSFQGLKFKDKEMATGNYQAYHVDFLYNIANYFRRPSEQLPRWDLSPYVGLGFAHGSDILSMNDEESFENDSNYPFIFSYGINARYRLNKNLHLTGEFGGFTSFANFDGYGSNSKFADNMFSFSIGISVTLGPGWNRAIDANKYIAQNRFLVNYCNGLLDENKQLKEDYVISENTNRELKKILEVEGLLDKYSYLFDKEKNNGKNNYKGLLSLKARLRNMQGGQENQFEGFDNSMMEEGIDGGMNIPIYFFFKLGTAELTDQSQLVNLQELAKVVKNHNLSIRIDGAADSATGTTDINNDLSTRRAKYIGQELMKLGIAKESLKAFRQGGIAQFSKPEQNRYARVAIVLEIDNSLAKHKSASVDE